MFGRRRPQRARDDEPLPVLLPEPVLDEALALVGADQRIEAVKLVRRRTGLSLLLAVRALDAAAARGHH